MPKRHHHPKRRGHERRLSIRSELRREPDVGKIARAVVALALAEAEREAQAERESQHPQGQAEADRE